MPCSGGTEVFFHALLFIIESMLSSGSSGSDSDTQSTPEGSPYQRDEQKVQTLPVRKDSDIVGGKIKTYCCPVDFTCCNYSPQKSLTLDIIDRPSTELWLIKAPPDFDPSSLSKKKIPLVGCRSFETNEDGNKKVYNSFSIVKEVTGTVLITETPDTSRVCKRSFLGCINIRESCGDENVKSPLKTVPASQTLHIHEGLKQRFQPFGTTKVKKPFKMEKNAEEHRKRALFKHTYSEHIKKGTVHSKALKSSASREPVIEQAQGESKATSPKNVKRMKMSEPVSKDVEPHHEKKKLKVKHRHRSNKNDQ
ncbi:DNA-directed RNA polymerase I subunit RPA34 [Protopterus annectens]|uniref:DNA-directed RNA polymerase I subunit RPA34 n=1 Tax=Protopterus annectens TaxID=7888 RepID=UPI001CFC269C|nr:DNA-directed RNA polymerase I subunit RPA34 [Protopterus annectens]